MRRGAMAALAVLVSAAAAPLGAWPAWPAGPARPLFVQDARHPDEVIRLVLAHLEAGVPRDFRQFQRFFWFGASPDDRLVEHVTKWRAALHTVSSDEYTVTPVPVRGAGGRLWAVDYRDLRWTANAVAAVFRRDQRFREPNVSHRLAEAVRREVGVAQDPATFHVEAVVPGEWFVKQVEKTEDSPAYYDLLYAAERYGPDPAYRPGRAVVVPGPLPPEPAKPAGRPWPGGVWQPDGRYYAPGAFTWAPEAELAAYEKAHADWERQKAALAAGPVIANEALPAGRALAAKLLKDFPEDAEQFEERWGIKALAGFLDKQQLGAANGEVVAGGKSDPKRGSVVAYQDRVIRFYQSPFGGASTHTQDFLRTAGRRNPANFPRDAALEQLDEDLGEWLFDMPNHFQAALLTGSRKGGRKRAEFGDTRGVHSSQDPADVTIYTQFSCTICHAPQDGLIAPSNRKVGEALAARIELFEGRKADERAVRSFFLDWEYKLGPWRTHYARALGRATATPDNPKGWAGGQLAEATVRFRDWYDAPVGPEQAAAELGVSQLAVMVACLVEGTIDAQRLFLGQTVPRTAWDDVLYTRLALIVAAARLGEGYDPLFEAFAPELIGQALDKANQGKAK